MDRKRRPACAKRSTLAATCFSLKSAKSILFYIQLFVIVACCGCLNYSDKDPVNASTPNQPQGLERYEDGENLFRRNCAACHGTPHKIIDGPNIFDRLFDRLPNPQENYFKKFVMDGKSLRQSGDTYQRHLQEVYRVGSMHNFRNKLTEIELEEILVYLKVVNLSNEKKLK